MGQRVEDAKGNVGKYSWLTFSQVGEARTALGSGLIHLGFRPGTHVGIYSVNCVEWSITDHACHAYSMVPVPLYDTLGPDAVQYICTHAKTEVVFCSYKVLDNLLASSKDSDAVKLVVVFGLGQGASLPASASGFGCDVLKFQDLLKIGQANPKSHVPPRPSQLCKICYTSGTTGVPKGVMITHSNILANIAGAEVSAGLQSFRIPPLSSMPWLGFGIATDLLSDRSIDSIDGLAFLSGGPSEAGRRPHLLLALGPHLRAHALQFPDPPRRKHRLLQR